MMRMWMKLFPVLASALSMTVAGCGTRCDEAANRIESKLISCDIEVLPPDPSYPDPECTEELADQSECVARCVEAATCDALTGNDYDGSLEYTSCVADC